MCNRAILWVLYDTGIRVSELCGLRLPDFDRKHGVLTLIGKGSKKRRIALGSNCLRNLLYYLDRYRPDEDELAGKKHEERAGFKVESEHSARSVSSTTIGA